MTDAMEFWTDKTSVLLTSFWRWKPDIWGTVGWTGDPGRTRREKLLEEFSDPFIAILYVTESSPDPNLKGVIAGFYLVSHEKGHRNDFTHPTQHNHEPGKWEHSLRAIRAFTYLPEYRRRVFDLFPELEPRARSIGRWGRHVTDKAKIDLLQKIPHMEGAVYSPRGFTGHTPPPDRPPNGMVPAGPGNKGGYIVAPRNQPRELYVLRLTGDTDAYLGRPSEGRSIFKIGLSASPELRRQNFQNSMPEGAFKWEVHRTTRRDGDSPYSDHSVAVVGEDEMKVILAQNAEWLGGEFYLASNAQINKAWEVGRKAAEALERGGA